jgi:hypothetical protein
MDSGREHIAGHRCDGTGRRTGHQAASRRFDSAPFCKPYPLTLAAIPTIDRINFSHARATKRSRTADRSASGGLHHFNKDRFADAELFCLDQTGRESTDKWNIVSRL